jgi:hypothetical protein
VPTFVDGAKIKDENVFLSQRFLLNKKMETGSHDSRADTSPPVDRAGNSERQTVMKEKHVGKLHDPINNS